MQIGVPGEKQRLDFRDLAVAAGDSCRDPYTLRLHLFERPTIAVECCVSACETLPSLDDNVDVLRIKLQSRADALRQFSRGKRGAAAKKWLVN